MAGQRPATRAIPGLAPWEITVFQWLLTHVPRRHQPPPEPAVDATAGMAGFPAPFLALLDRLLPATLPASFTDGFAALNTWAESLDYDRGRVRIEMRSFLNDQDNFVTAHALLAGERLISFQNGAYGFPGLVGLQAGLEYAQNRFISWGWTGQDDWPVRAVPLPSPQYSRLARQRRPGGEEIILVGAKLFAAKPRIDYYPQPLPYRRNKAVFLDHLTPTARERLFYRPYMVQDDFEDEAWVLRHHPSLRILRDNAQARMLSCRLLVLDHPSSTLCLAYGANIPTVCFWNPDEWLVARQSEPYFQALREAGLLFDHPEEAAAQVNATWERVEEWWAEKPVQAARRAWAERYARARRLWWLHWLWTLARL
ncbi:hypothetical protein WCLP8_2590003 [uncultured Gammaproteobacteria bacterium]